MRKRQEEIFLSTMASSKIRQFIHKYYETETISLLDIRKIVFPIFVDQTLVALLNFLNSSMVSGSGPEAISAVNMVDSLNNMLINFFIAIATGGTVVVAQYIGRREPEKAGKVTVQAILSSTLVALALCVFILLFRMQVLNFLFGAAEKAVLDNAVIYITGSCLSYPFFAIFQSTLGAMRGMGDGRASMVLSVAMNAIYVAGNLLFINVLQMGVLGVAVSVILSRFIGSLMALFFLFFIRKDLHIKLRDFLHLDLKLQKNIMYVGIPTGIEQVFFHSGRMLTQTYIVPLGTASIAGNAIANSLAGILYIPGNTINLCIVTLVGQCIGAGKPKEAKKYMLSMTLLAGVLLLISGVIYIAAAPLLVSFYKPLAESADIAIKAMTINAIGMPTLWIWSFIVPSGLRAAGDVRFTSVVALVSMWLVRVILGYVLAVYLGFGVLGVWTAMVLEWSFRGSIFIFRMRGTKWYQHKII